MRIFEATKAIKKIDDIPILSDLSFSIYQGECIAITGQNGSGKSSLLKLIGGIYEETSGKVWRAQHRVGYVPEHFPETIRFKLNEYLMLMGKMSGQSTDVIHEAITQYANRFAISNFLSTPLKKCSKGTKQKAGIIQALLMEPEVLLMDEPLTGLDDDSQKELLEQLHHLSDKITFIFTAHDSFLIDQLAQRVIRVDGGNISSDTYKQQKERFLLIRARIPSKEAIADVPFGQQNVIGDKLVELVTLESESDQVLRLLLERGCSIQKVIEKR